MAEMMKQGGMPTAAPKPGQPVSVDKDIKPLVEEIEAMLAGGGAPGAGQGPGPNEAGASVGAEGTPNQEAPAGGMGDAQMVAEVLGVSTEKAQQLLDAAKAMPRFADMSAAEIADMLSKDMNLRMQLEKNMGASEDMKTKETMAQGGPPPMEPTSPKPM
jgi:cell division septum initiation protein DivIVA